MKTMKENWMCPDVNVQVFNPQEFIASCHGYDDAYEARCRNVSGLIFFDADDTNGKYVSDANRGGCGQPHTFRATDGVDLTELRQGNCWILLNLRTRQPGDVTITRRNVDTYFSSHPDYGSVDWSNGVGFVLRPAYYELMVRGYYNSECLGGGGWLVTDELQKIHPSS